MRHAQIGRKLGVSSSHRIALLRNLTLALLEHEQIKTTSAKAKELRWFADRVVTLAKRGDVHGRRTIVKLLGSTETSKPGENRVRNAIDRIYTVLVPRFKDRPGGYTQILRLAQPRPGDCADMCIMRYIPGEEKKGGKPAGKDKGGKKVAAKGGKEAKASDKPAKKEAAPKAEKAAEKAEKKTAEPQDKPAKAKAKKKD